MFPKLNAFGEAFRLRGYRMPGETEEMVKQPPVSLGAPAYKRLWPQADLAGRDLERGAAGRQRQARRRQHVVAQRRRHGDARVNNDLQFPQEVNIFGAGTLGDHVSYLGEVTFAENPDGSVAVELEHAHMGFDSPFGPEDLFHFRIGKFAPNLVDGFQEMWISTDAGIDSLFAYNPIGMHGGTGLARTRQPDRRSRCRRSCAASKATASSGTARCGSPASPTASGRAATDTTGRFDGNSAKDVYARFDYKIGGMGLDGDTGGQPVPDKNWRDNSLRLGVFAYRGDGSGIDFPSTTADGLDDEHPGRALPADRRLRQRCSTRI